jgi:phosphate starvation-inducible protein PhoH
MPTPIERAVAHLNKLEDERRAAIALSKEKAQEAKLLRARQEGFQEALEILDVDISLKGEEVSTSTTGQFDKRTRRNIPQFISNELSFSGKAMTTNQIAKAIDYLPERTEKALERMESSGQIIRTEDGRWTVDIRPEKINGHARATAIPGLGGQRSEIGVQE